MPSPQRIGARIAALAAVVFAASLPAQPQSTAPAWTLTERLRLDANSEDFSALQLTRQGNAPFYIGPKHEIVIPFQQDGQIRIYDSTGKRLSSVGQRGSGPGEFRNFFRLGWLRDTMWVYDAAQRRMSFFDPQRNLLRTHVTSETLRRPVEPGDANPRVITDFAPSAISPDGKTIGQIIRTEGRNPGGWLELRYFVAAVSPDNTVRELTEIPAAAISPRVWMPTGTETRYAYAIVPFANDAIYAVSQSGERYTIITTDRAAKTFSVAMYNASGTRQFSKTFPFTPAAIPKAVADSALGAAMRTVRQPPEVIAAMQKKVGEVMPGTYAPVTSVVLARDGTTWLRLHSPDGRRVTMMVLNARGDAVGSVTVPKAMDIVDAEGSTVWSVDVDADGLGSVVVHTVAKAR
jgi:hypothetical protein